MKIAIGSDHAGYNYRLAIIEHLNGLGHEVKDFGTYRPESTDYPLWIIPTAEAVANGEAERGIVLGGSGNGEAIAANKVDGVRAALAWSEETARLGRQHNDANVVAVGGRQHSLEEATELIEAFLAEPFSQDERHVRRIGKIAHYETTGEVLM